MSSAAGLGSPSPWDPGTPMGGDGKRLLALFSALLLLSFPTSACSHPLASPSPLTWAGGSNNPGLPFLTPPLLPEHSQCPSESAHLGSKCFLDHSSRSCFQVISLKTLFLLPSIFPSFCSSSFPTCLNPKSSQHLLLPA